MAERERKLGANTVEIMTRLDPRISETLDWKAARGPAAILRRLFLVGLAASALLEFRKLAPRIFLLTNDGADSRPEPYDFGSIPESVLKKYPWRPVRRGFGDDGFFKADPGFDNYVIESDDGTFADFVEEYLGRQMHPLRYWFCFAEEVTQISHIVEAVVSASDEDDLMTHLCKRCLVVTYGFEEDAFAFFTSRESIAKTIRESLSQDAGTELKQESI